VREYLVLVLSDHRAVWFARAGLNFLEVASGADNVLRSPNFPGLWLDAGALLREDDRRFQEVLNMGLQSPEHAAFVAAHRKP
jgi:hypothetical protein